MKAFTVVDLDRCSYQRALDAQLALWQRVAEGEDRAFLVLVEHDPPVITLGRRAEAGHLLASRERLAAAGVELHEVTRGGSATWHGPGQLVAYPILRLTGRAGGLHSYVRDLEETVIRVAAGYGVAASRSKGATGVWVGPDKLAAIGVAVKKWVTYHGLALNVCPDLAGFGLIVPCGLADRGVTSLSKLLGREIPVEEVKPKLVEAFAEVMGLPADEDRDSEDRGETHTGRLPVPHRRLPAWFRRPMPNVQETANVRRLLGELRLSTVCQGATVPEYRRVLRLRHGDVHGAGRCLHAELPVLRRPARPTATASRG